jgi:hypothetical protein
MLEHGFGVFFCRVFFFSDARFCVVAPCACAHAPLKLSAVQLRVFLDETYTAQLCVPTCFARMDFFLANARIYAPVHQQLKIHAQNHRHFLIFKYRRMHSA